MKNWNSFFNYFYQIITHFEMIIRGWKTSGFRAKVASTVFRGNAAWWTRDHQVRHVVSNARWSSERHAPHR